MVKNIDASDLDLNNNLKKIREWPFQWKINFNFNLLSKHETNFFFRKVQMINHLSLSFNQNIVPQTTFQKLLGMLLGNKLNISEHLKIIFQKTNKTIELLLKLNTLSVRTSLITVYKLFVKHTWIMSVRYMIKLSLCRFNKEWKPFNIM